MLTRMMHGAKSLESISPTHTTMEYSMSSNINTTIIFNNVKKSEERESSPGNQKKTVKTSIRTSPMLKISPIYKQSEDLSYFF